jgi:hypothetical protein
MDCTENTSNAQMLTLIAMKSHELRLVLFFLLKKSDARSSFFNLEKKQGVFVLEMNSGK